MNKLHQENIESSPKWNLFDVTQMLYQSYLSKSILLVSDNHFKLNDMIKPADNIAEPYYIQ